MKKINHILILCCLIISCSTNTEKDVSKIETNKVDSLVMCKSELDTIQKITSPIIKKSKYLISKIEKEKDSLQHITFTFKDNVIDSLNKISSIYDTSHYNGLAISYFTSLADNLNGKAFFAENADSLIETIMEIFSTRVKDTTDIVFLIDKTGSMDDDIKKVKTSLSFIINYLSKFKNIRIGIAAYGDENWHYDLWYNSIDLTSDIQKINDFMDSFHTIGNPDIAESVNDGIIKTVEKMNWADGSKRLMLVIGDAPSLEPPFSKYSIEEVVKICSERNVIFNLYPIILSVEHGSKIETFVKKDFVNVYPNPVSEFLNVQLDYEGDFFYIIYDLSGKKIRFDELYGINSRISFSGIENGIYLLQIMDNKTDMFFSKKIILQR